MKDSVAVLIINYESTSLLSRCLESIANQSTAVSKVLILNNSIGDPISEDLRDIFLSVDFYKSDHNIGFAAGNNFLLSQVSDCDWVALVNPDVFIEPDWLNKLLSVAGKYPEYSFFACRLIQYNRQNFLDGEGDVFHVSGQAWRRNYGRPTKKNTGKPEEVFSACAAAALYRRAALTDIGGFDEDYFCYFEDVDLGFRLRLAGHSCLFVPDAVAYHVGSASAGGKQSDFVVYHGHRNLVWTYVKNMPGALFWFLLPVHIILNILTMLLLIMRGKRRVILKAKYDALRGIPRMWKKRREIQKNREIGPWKIWKALDKSILPRFSGKLKKDS